MKTYTFDDRNLWMAARAGKITGTRLKNIITHRGTAKKIGFYEVIAERIAAPLEEVYDEETANETAMARGTRLEKHALEQFSAETGKALNTDLIIWTREDDENIALSPDGVVVDSGDTEAVEAKCLSSSRHVEALLTQEVPDDYYYQMLQYFIVNDDLKTLYFVFYDPRILVKKFFYLTIERSQVQEDVDTYLTYQKVTLAEIEDAVKGLLNLK